MKFNFKGKILPIIFLLTSVTIPSCGDDDGPSDDSYSVISVAPYKVKDIGIDGCAATTYEYMGYATINEIGQPSIYESIRGFKDIYEEGHIYKIRIKKTVDEHSELGIIPYYKLDKVISSKAQTYFEMLLILSPKGDNETAKYSGETNHGNKFHLNSISGFDEIYNPMHSYTLLIRADFDPTIKDNTDAWPNRWGPYKYSLVKIVYKK